MDFNSKEFEELFAALSGAKTIADLEEIGKKALENEQEAKSDEVEQ